jgi:hypothetical protein
MSAAQNNPRSVQSGGADLTPAVGDGRGMDPPPLVAMARRRISTRSRRQLSCAQMLGVCRVPS